MPCGPTDVKYPEETPPRRWKTAQRPPGLGLGEEREHRSQPSLPNKTPQIGVISGIGHWGTLIAHPETGTQDRGSSKLSSWGRSSSCLRPAACTGSERGLSSLGAWRELCVPSSPHKDLSDQNPSPHDSLNLNYVQEGPSGQSHCSGDLT